MITHILDFVYFSIVHKNFLFPKTNKKQIRISICSLTFPIVKINCVWASFFPMHPLLPKLYGKVAYGSVTISYWLFPVERIHRFGLNLLASGKYCSLRLHVYMDILINSWKMKIIIKNALKHPTSINYVQFQKTYPSCNSIFSNISICW